MSADPEQAKLEAPSNENQPAPKTSQQYPDEFRDWVIEKHQLLLSIPQKLEEMIAENEKRQAEVQEELFELVRNRRTLVDKREPIAEVIRPYIRKLELVAPMIGISPEDFRHVVPSQGSLVAVDNPASPQHSQKAVPCSNNKPKRGRPRMDDVREMMGKLLPTGKNWPQIQKEMNRTLNQNKTAEAYRKLWGSKNTALRKIEGN